MTQNLKEMTITELKQYISENRNDEEVFHAALQELMSRRDPNAIRYPNPFDLADPIAEMEAIFKEKLEQIKRAKQTE